MPPDEKKPEVGKSSIVVDETAKWKPEDYEKAKKTLTKDASMAHEVKKTKKRLFVVSNFSQVDLPDGRKIALKDGRGEVTEEQAAIIKDSRFFPPKLFEIVEE